MRSLAYIGVSLFLAFFAVGYSYFYPSNSPLADQAWFANGVVPSLDSWLVRGQRGNYSGHLVNSIGELKFKSDSDFVFYAARRGQRFYGKTMLSSGMGSTASIEVAEGVQLQLDSNSMLIIEPQVDGQNDGPTIRVISGAVIAKATQASTKKVRVVSSNGKSRVVDQKGIAVVSDGKGYIGAIPQNISSLREAYASQTKQIAEQERLMREESARALAQQAQRIEAEKKIQNFEIASTEIKAPERSPASSVEKAVRLEVPQKIGQRKFNANLVGTAKVAPNTSVAKGLYQAKLGQKSEATRSFASALSSPLYQASQSFSPSVQVALDGMLESYLLNSRCPLAKDTLANASRQYKSSAAAQTWAKNWSTRLKKEHCQ